MIGNTYMVPGWDQRTVISLHLEERDLDFARLATVTGHCCALPFLVGDSSAFGLLVSLVEGVGWA
jgi:hypothetical protein